MTSGASIWYLINRNERKRKRAERGWSRLTTSAIVYEFSNLLSGWPPSLREDLLYRIRSVVDLDPNEADYWVSDISQEYANVDDPGGLVVQRLSTRTRQSRSVQQDSHS